MMSKIKSLSIFFPAHNEESNIEKTLIQALKVIPKYLNKFEIIVVDDGSTDKTKAVVENIAKNNPDVKLLSHSSNQGYGAALKTGFYNCKYPLIVFTDADGQFNFDQIGRFLDKINQADLVIGYRIKRVEGILRQFNAKSWSILIRILFGLSVKDIDCGFKLVRKRVIDTIPKLQSNGALISAELLIKAKKKGFVIAEIPVDHFPRISGNPSGANPKVVIKAFKELFKVWSELR